MRRGALLLAMSAYAAMAGEALSSVAWAGPPVVVELYTAQGCVACAKATAHMSDLASEKGVLPLTFSVDYWDYLGWKDTFAKPEFADRQRAYDKRFGVAEPFTPQVVVAGRAQAAARPEKMDELVREARERGLDAPQMRWRGDDYVAVGGGKRPAAGAGVWLVRYDPKPREVTVKDGDNAGHKLTERNVVVELTRLGAWRGRPVLLKLTAPSDDGLKTAVIVQADNGGRILGVLAGP